MTDKVVELTGMDGKQFRQIVMIAQGEFRKFLLSSSVEKGKILRQLFHTQNCDKIQQILKERLDQQRAHVREQETQMLTLLHQASPAGEKQAELYDNLIEAIEDTDDMEDAMSYSEDKNFLPDYQELYMQNNDMVGWIKVEDTKINYPVMQSKDNPNFYLRHGFDKGYTVYGCPYVQENCDVDAPSDNLVIYGHHMNDKSMFAGLMKYADKSFWEKHKTIQFDTLTEKGKYEVVAAFKTEVYTDSPNSFRYYDFVNADTADDFNAYIAKCKELAIYDTGVNAEYGDKLITLSTCEYSRNNGRMVVVAKKVAE